MIYLEPLPMASLEAHLDLFLKTEKELKVILLTDPANMFLF